EPRSHGRGAGSTQAHAQTGEAAQGAGRDAGRGDHPAGARQKLLRPRHRLARRAVTGTFTHYHQEPNLMSLLKREQTAPAWQFALIAIIVVVLVAVVATLMPASIDWRTAFRPAAREMLATGNPYHVEGFFNPPWTVLPMIPLALLPERVGSAAMLVLGLAGFAYGAHRLGASPLVLGAFLLSPPVLHSLLNGNIDWLPIVGFVLPPQIGLFFVLTKPQMGSAVAVFWLVEAWREGGFKEAVRVFGP